MKALVIGVLVGVIGISGNTGALNLADGRWIDLTHEFSEETIYWPTSDPFKHETVFEGVTKKGFYYTAYALCAAEHGGTHLDAPIHFAKGRRTVEQIPIDQLIGPAVVIDVSRKALKDRDYQVGVADFVVWEQKQRIKVNNCIVLIYTGFSQFWPDKIKYMGTDKKGEEGVAELHFPGLHPNTAKWLVSNRNIKAIGLDTPSIDYGQSKLFESHQILFKKNISAFENIANLDKLPAIGATVFALPMKVKGGSGAPLRIVAFVP